MCLRSRSGVVASRWSLVSAVGATKASVFNAKQNSRRKNSDDETKRRRSIASANPEPHPIVIAGRRRAPIQLDDELPFKQVETMSGLQEVLGDPWICHGTGLDEEMASLTGEASSPTLSPTSSQGIWAMQGPGGTRAGRRAGPCFPGHILAPLLLELDVNTDDIASRSEP